MSNPSNEILTESADRISWITLNRPEKRNALNFTLISDLKSAIRAAEGDPSTKVIVIRANGKAFCSGADLEYLQRLQNFSFDENLQDSAHLMDLFLAIYKCAKPVIAQVEGHALAGGCGLVTVCDYAFTVPEAKFGYTEVKIGFIPAIVMYFLIRKSGEGVAKDLLLSGRIISAEDAKGFRIVNEVVPAEALRQHVSDFAKMLCEKNSGQSMAITKKMIADIQHFPVDEALRFASRMNAHARSSEDCKRGIAGFLNKEEINW